MCNILHEVENASASSICMTSTTLSVMLIVFMNVRIVLCCELRNGIILTPFITDGTLYLQLKKAIKEPLKHFSLLFGEFLAI